ncbi:unnamed protein product [Anisakis simplex]|uniref:Tyramine receptor tyra-2 (inferred by orthology to a C. elegans protein) n=1 Tax=Anisakis simplex TaxID=6269 RepID=A0A0M3JXX0_ANISI|nr:unnamed protein product [Anisakis simplex]
MHAVVESSLELFQTFKGAALTLLVLWTIAANTLVFIVLYKNPRLQTVPNLLVQIIYLFSLNVKYQVFMLQVGNLAFSDLCLGLIVLPLSSVYAIAGEWLFTSTLCVVFVSADILCSTASIWNLSIVGLDRYWAITSPVSYMSKRNKRTAGFMILSVWISSALISLAPLLGWKQIAERGNMVQINGTWQCVFLDLPSYTIYSATGSFFIPTIVMFFVYFKIYQAFAKHRARQIYRQKVIKKHIESTILHEISHVMPTSDEFAKEEDEDDDDDDDASGSSCHAARNGDAPRNGPVVERRKDRRCIPNAQRNTSSPKTYSNKRLVGGKDTATATTTSSATHWTEISTGLRKQQQKCAINRGSSLNRSIAGASSRETNKKHLRRYASERCVAFRKNDHNSATRSTITSSAITYEKVQHHKNRRERSYRKSLQQKPKAISAAKERRGVKVLGIILGCFTICWTPFFIMYVVVQFCSSCALNPHIEMFITWLGYSNSAMNPIIYTVRAQFILSVVSLVVSSAQRFLSKITSSDMTSESFQVFNRDYQIALKRLFTREKNSGVGILRRPL